MTDFMCEHLGEMSIESPTYAKRGGQMKINDRKKMKRKKMGSFGAYKSFVVCGKVTSKVNGPAVKAVLAPSFM